MSTFHKIQRVKGVSDVLSREYGARQHIEQQLLSHFYQYGYAPLASPILEHSELYLRKSGEDIIARMYDFQYRNRRLCLRPEMTASIIRAYLDQLYDEPMPTRLCYAGSVFRYEKPQRARYRQFTQVGVELIGASGALAEGEIMHLACTGLDRIGIQQYQLVMGHIGILTEFLNHIGLEGQLRSFLIFNMELLRKQGQGLSELLDRIHTIYPMFQRSSDDSAPFTENTLNENRSQKLIDLLKHMDESEARQAVIDFLFSLNITLDSNRDENEIVDRLLSKIRRDEQIPRLNKAIQFMHDLSQLNGTAETVLREAERLAEAYELSRAPLEQIAQLIQVLRAYGLDQTKLTLDLGLSRGLQYYTGAMFEIYHTGKSEAGQLCGGGRYDDLIHTLGGPKTPATGFAYGLERLYLALEAEQHLKTADFIPQVLVIPLEGEELSDSIRIAQQLRDQALRVEMTIRERSLKSSLQYADRRGIPYVLILGSQERAADQVRLREMGTRTESLCDLTTAIRHIKEAVNV
ncbi:MAG: ATP phosphoribosyltransferase regulatory subunit [Anaerolineae bacterium]|jgi:histidyl-tRNA synthetase|nr:ATP phosphoribosyltransferase regulatory subunit [Anaerolineae bacterium]